MKMLLLVGLMGFVLSACELEHHKRYSVLCVSGVKYLDSFGTTVMYDQNGEVLKCQTN